MGSEALVGGPAEGEAAEPGREFMAKVGAYLDRALGAGNGPAEGDGEARRREHLERYRAAKTAALARRGVPMGNAAPAVERPAPAPRPGADRGAPRLDAEGARILAGLYEATRLELVKGLSGAFGKRGVQDLMRRTYARFAAQRPELFGPPGPDGRLDPEAFARGLCDLPDAVRHATARDVLGRLLQLRLSAVELGLGRAEGRALARRLLAAAEASAKGTMNAALGAWYRDLLAELFEAESK